MSSGVGLGFKAAIAALVVQQIDNHIISPNVMKRTVQLHPVTVMLGLLAGGTLAGFWGVLLAVPAIAVAKIIIGHLWTTRVLGLEPTPFSSDEAVPDDPDAEEVLEENKEKEEQLDEQS
jgi:predicted PurR-regulated permease PerM